MVQGSDGVADVEMTACSGSWRRGFRILIDFADPWAIKHKCVSVGGGGICNIMMDLNVVNEDKGQYWYDIVWLHYPS